MIRAAGMARNDSKTSSEVSISRNNELMTIPAPPLHQHREETFGELIPRSSNVYLVFIFYWNRLGIRLMTEKTPGPGYRCKMESRVCDFGSQKWKISFNLIIPLLWSFRNHQIIIEHGTDRLIKHMNQSNGVTSNSSWNGTVPLEHL